MSKGNVVQMGQTEIGENDGGRSVIDYALVIQFKSAEDLCDAIQAKRVEFTILESGEG